MFSLDAYAGLPSPEPFLHGLHFMLCAFAVLIACVPLLTDKGSTEHKFAGLVYLPVSLGALLLATYMAWVEASFILFCFNGFCAYLLLSGWRAVHEQETPKAIDWILPAGLLLLSTAVIVRAFMDDTTRGLYLFGFALNGFYLSWRDLRYLQKRQEWSRVQKFLGSMEFGATGWLNRHVAGMLGSLMANVSVLVLTLLPLELHWLWPAVLIAAGLAIAWKERQKKLRVRRAMAPLLRPGFGRVTSAREPQDDDIRRAA